MVYFMSKSTQELVFDAADELLKEGTRPSQQNVRARIGKGSATTIHKALSSWWQQLSSRLQHTEGPDQLPAFLSSALSEIWQQALTQARSNFAESEKQAKEQLLAEKQQLETMRSETREKTEQLAGRLDKAFQRIEELQAELEQGRRDNLQLEKQLVQGGSELAELRRSDKTQSRVIEQLEKQLDQSVGPDQTRSSSERFGLVESGPASARLEQENSNLRAAVAELDTRLADRENKIGALQEELLEAKRRYYRLESGVESELALKEAGYQGRIEAQECEINRLLALLADKR